MFCFDKRFEGRVYKNGRALIEILYLGASIALVEVHEPCAEPFMQEVSIADCEINIFSGKWKPASFNEITNIAVGRIVRPSA